MTEHGPIYNVPLLDSLHLSGSMKQALPSRDDLNAVMMISVRTVAGYEVLLGHYRAAMQRVTELEAEVIRLQSKLSTESGFTE